MGNLVLTLCLPVFCLFLRVNIISATSYTVAFVRDMCPFDFNHLNTTNSNTDINISYVCLFANETWIPEMLFSDKTIDVFVGPLNFVIDSETRRYAEMYKKPYISPYSGLPYSDNSQSFPLSANFFQMGNALEAIFTHFRWKNMLIVSVYEDCWMEMATSLFIKLSEANFRPAIRYIREHIPGYDIEDILDDISSSQKGIILCVDIKLRLRILRLATTRHMQSRHAFFTFSTSPYTSITDDDYEELEDDSRDILESLFVIRPVFKATSDRTYTQFLNFLDDNSDLQTGAKNRDNNTSDITNSIVANRKRRSDNSYSDLSKEELKFYQDASIVIEHLLTLYPVVSGLETSRLFHALANMTIEIVSGEMIVSSLAEIHFDFQLYDFDSDEFEFIEVQKIVKLRDGRTELIGVSRITWPNNTPVEPDDCFLPEDCQSHTGLDTLYILAIVIAVLFVAGTSTLIFIVVWRKVIHREMSKGHHKVLLTNEDLVFLQRKDVQKGSSSKVLNGNIPEKPDLLKPSEKPTRSLASLNEYSDTTETARYNGDLVHVKELKVKGFEMKSKVLTVIKSLRDIRHENVNCFIGFYEDQHKPAFISDYCIRGSLEDVLHNSDIKLDWDFKLSLLTDLIRGVRFVHNSTIRWHGNLKCRNCVIDSRWVLKVTDFGLSSFYEASKFAPEYTETDYLWTAPEHLRHPVPLLKGSEKGDVYSVSIIMQCVVLRSEPYSTSGLTPNEIIQKLRHPPPLLRPSVKHGTAPPQYIQLMKVCWAENPDMRPTIEEIYQQFKTITGGKKTNIVDTMFRMLEKYSNDLEDLVKERTTQLEEEKKKTDVLLYRMLPLTVADSLKIGSTVAAEQFSEVTIYFSDIVGFTTISARSTPMQVVDLLNGLYTMFDATIDSYDVYKVETIGDAYMVSSGLPVRNGNRHAGEISTMALDLLSQCGDFTIKHMPEVPLKVRIGIHSGSCVAGVVGLTMPRYCLFGDTVNTASRMETTGAAYRIHISQMVKDILDVLGGYNVEYRGEVELKGKGMAKTYWLIGKIGFNKKLPEPPQLTGLSLEDFRLGRKISTAAPQSPNISGGQNKTLIKSGIRKDLKTADIPDSPIFRHPANKKHSDAIDLSPQTQPPPSVLYPTVIQGNAVMADKIIEDKEDINDKNHQVLHTVTIHAPRETSLSSFSAKATEPNQDKTHTDERQRKVSTPQKDGVKHFKKHKSKLKRGSNTISPSNSPSKVSLTDSGSLCGQKPQSPYRDNSSIRLAFEESLV